MLSLAWPWVFLLLPLPWLYHRRLPPALVQNSALKTPFFNQLLTLQPPRRTTLAASLRLFFLLLTWLLLLLAAARPQQIQQLALEPEQGQVIMLAIDLSNSMNIKDANPEQPDYSRLDLVKQLVSELMAQRPADRFGLIFFASAPYLQSPTTHDHQSLQHWLQLARAGMIGERTAIGDAIGLAIKLLQPQAQRKKTIILITDGANNSGSMPPLTAASHAAAMGLKIHSIGVGNHSRDNQVAGHDLDEELLQQLAQISGGEYLRIEQLQQLPLLLELMTRLEPATKLEIQQQFHELYRYPLLLAMLLSCLLALHSMHGHKRRQSTDGAGNV